MALPERTPAVRYLGDAVYVDRDPLGGIVLTTEDGIDVTNRVVLEPEVLARLIAYLREKGYLR